VHVFRLGLDLHSAGKEVMSGTQFRIGGKDAPIFYSSLQVL